MNSSQLPNLHLEREQHQDDVIYRRRPPDDPKEEPQREPTTPEALEAFRVNLGASNTTWTDKAKVFYDQVYEY